MKTQRSFFFSLDFLNPLYCLEPLSFLIVVDLQLIVIFFILMGVYYQRKICAQAIDFHHHPAIQS